MTVGGWCDRTIFNWRCWVVLPITPVLIAGVCIVVMAENVDHSIRSITAWVRKGYPK